MVDRPSERLTALGMVLPPPPKPAGTYVPVVRAGTLAFVSGQIATEHGAVLHPGTVDRDVPFATAVDLARRAALQALSALAEALGSIDRVRRAVRVGVFVAVSRGFHREHEVANGATQLLVDIFGEGGRPARSTIGVAGLPLGAAVEVELVVETE